MSPSTLMTGGHDVRQSNCRRFPRPMHTFKRDWNRWRDLFAGQCMTAMTREASTFGRTVALKLTAAADFGRAPRAGDGRKYGFAAIDSRTFAAAGRAGECQQHSPVSGCCAGIVAHGNDDSANATTATRGRPLIT